MVQKPKMPRLNVPAETKVLVVCHGNICRSPLAGAVLAHALGAERVRDRGLSKDGQIVAKKIRDYAEDHRLRQCGLIGADLNEHRSKVVTAEDMAWANIILYMDNANLAKLLTRGCPREKLHCLGHFIALPRIPDPNYMTKGPELDKVLGQVVEAARTVARGLTIGEK